MATENMIKYTVFDSGGKCLVDREEFYTLEELLDYIVFEEYKEDSPASKYQLIGEIEGNKYYVFSIAKREENKEDFSYSYYNPIAIAVEIYNENTEISFAKANKLYMKYKK